MPTSNEEIDRHEAERTEAYIAFENSAQKNESALAKNQFGLNIAPSSTIRFRRDSRSSNSKRFFRLETEHAFFGFLGMGFGQ